MPFADKKHHIISYHDTWISLDPVRFCPYRCKYCVLRHSKSTGKKPKQAVTPKECVDLLLRYKFFRQGNVPIAIGNETDMLHVLNFEYLTRLLEEIICAGIDNPIALITKAPLARVNIKRLKAVAGSNVVFFLSYSGLGPKFEPNFTDEQLRGNFEIARSHGFPVIHFWRPLIRENTTTPEIQKMLSFASRNADASVFVGLKLHPELTKESTRKGDLRVPKKHLHQYGEWLDPETIRRIYGEAKDICPDYPLYRHTSCALASVLRRPNHTATVYRDDICLPSHCHAGQRSICQASQELPSDLEISRTLGMLGREIDFEQLEDNIFIRGAISQEEFPFLLHQLNYPIKAESVAMQNLYHGNIYEGQRVKISSCPGEESNSS